MSNDDGTLIPFGLRSSDGILVDVEAVENGSRCGCVCPSCGAPLVARQGDVNIWHFGHAARGPSDQFGNVCEYSFYVSVRRMAQQIIRSGAPLALPKYQDEFRLGRDRLGYPQVHTFTITASRTVHLANVAIEGRYDGVELDVVGHVGGFVFGAFLSCPGRDVPETVRALSGPKLGVVVLKLDGLRQRFHEHRRNQGSFAEVLRNFVSTEVLEKRWIYHPRYDHELQKARTIAEHEMERRRKSWAKAKRGKEGQLRVR